MRTRIITGLVFGIVLIGGIRLSAYTCLLLFLFILAGGLIEYLNILKTQGIQPFKPLTFLLAFSAFFACIFVPVAYQAASLGIKELFMAATFFLTLLLLIFVAEIFRNKVRPFENVAAALFPVFYLALPLGLLLDASIDSTGSYSWIQVLFFFLFMWASDTGAYFSGMAFGKHKLLERLSPKKTIEGFIGGVVLSVITGWAAFHFIGKQSLLFWLIGGAILSFTGTLGDLFESMLKRQAGIKDSGNLLPGHGGILDRFDSTFLSAPVYFLIIHAL